MKKQTITVECTRRGTGEKFPCEVVAERIGPFAVHRCTDSDWRWTVTHVATGFAVKSWIGSRKAAVNAARQLRELGCWDFTTPDGVKAIPADKLVRIMEIRGRA